MREDCPSAGSVLEQLLKKFNQTTPKHFHKQYLHL